VAYIIADVGLSIMACVKYSIAFSNLPNHHKTKQINISAIFPRIICNYRFHKPLWTKIL